MDDDLDSLLDAAAVDVLGDNSNVAENQTSATDDKDSLDDLDDLLAAAADDLMLEEEEEAAAVATKKLVAANERSASGPTSWQETLQLLPVAERIEWATTISRDMDRIRRQGSQLSPFSHAYESGGRPIPQVTGYEQFKKLWADVVKGHEHEDELRNKVDLELIYKHYTSTLREEMKERVQYDASDVKASPARFPTLNSLLSS